MDMFDFLGLEPETPKAKETKAKKASVKTEPKKASTEVKDAVAFPVKVLTGYMDAVTYQASDFTKSVVTAKEVFEKFTSDNPSFPKSLCGYRLKTKNTLVVFFLGKYASSKVNVNVDSSTAYILAGTKLDLSTFMTDEKCVIEAQSLIEAFKKEYPKFGEVRLCYSATENTVIPYFAEQKLYSNVKLPVEVVFWNHEPFTVAKEDLDKDTKTKDVCEEDADIEDETEDETEDAMESSAETTIGAKQLLKVVEARFPECKGILELRYCKATHSIVVTVNDKDSAVDTKKETLYPTDAEVSLFINMHFQLSPEWFGGKATITEKELKKFLEERYPEFSPERTYIIYDEKKKLIMPCLKSSSKGALSIAVSDEEEEELKKSLFPYFREYNDGIYRVEHTPVADFRVCVEGDGSKNEFAFKLPKIPFSLLKATKEFFCKVYEVKGTEAFLQLFYDTEDGAYFLYLPEQIAGVGDVDADRDQMKEREFLLVADIHSHGRFKAFWSSKDNTDEKGSRIFGVMGGFHQKDGFSECFRIGCGGYFMEVDLSDVFDYSDYSEEVVCSVLDFLCDRMERIAVA